MNRLFLLLIIVCCVAGCAHRSEHNKAIIEQFRNANTPEEESAALESLRFEWKGNDRNSYDYWFMNGLGDIVSPAEFDKISKEGNPEQQYQMLYVFIIDGIPTAVTKRFKSANCVSGDVSRPKRPERSEHYEAIVEQFRNAGTPQEELEALESIRFKWKVDNQNMNTYYSYFMNGLGDISYDEFYKIARDGPPEQRYQMLFVFIIDGVPTAVTKRFKSANALYWYLLPG